ncbi:MAG TPA: dTDP-glucose 4,6-dehydratase [Vicinamibacteria bacterium]
MPTHILVTGGAGFIGSNFIHFMVRTRPEWRITNLDKLTYAGNLANLEGMDDHPGYRFVKGDICDRATVEPLVADADVIINFAAETHVDRSIHDAGQFILTDVYGTFVLLEAVRRASKAKLFVQISTDEVYGTIASGSAKEEDPLAPRNPYSASKAGADRLAYSYFTTYQVPVIVTRASNNYGPRQYPEKLIPLFITNSLQDEPVPIYGDGLQVRDWLHVEDHCRGLSLLMDKGRPGETYNIGGGTELTNMELTTRILALVGKPSSLIKKVSDRPGHDRRYSLDTTRLRSLGWRPSVDFDTGLAATVEWYRSNQGWWKAIKSGSHEYRRFYQKHYGEEPASH